MPRPVRSPRLSRRDRNHARPVNIDFPSAASIPAGQHYESGADRAGAAGRGRCRGRQSEPSGCRARVATLTQAGRISAGANRLLNPLRRVLARSNQSGRSRYPPPPQHAAAAPPGAPIQLNPSSPNANTGGPVRSQ